MDLDSTAVKYFLTEPPVDIQSMSMEEKVEFLLKERTLLSHMLASTLHILKKNHMIEYLPEKTRVSGLNSNYTDEEVKARYAQASTKAKEEIEDWKKTLQTIREKASQGDYDWIDTQGLVLSHRS